MKVAILAGGFGSRLAEETIPKPVVEIGGHPILWHIMKHFAHHGLRDFVVAVGHQGDVVRDRWRNAEGATTHGSGWSVDFVDTGRDTASGGRVLRLAPHIGDETFMLAYSDGLSDLNVGDLIAFHRDHGQTATVAAVRPPARFGRLTLKGESVIGFEEKPRDEAWINGGFFVLEPAVFDYIEGDESIWERRPLESLAADGQLMAFKHERFWQCMDTVHEKQILERMWNEGNAPWKTWGDDE